jgi:YebC/PmpR family DNA-binding regulatory protein
MNVCVQGEVLVSGHSKWSTIKRKKAKADAQRGKIFTKLIREIVVAARQDGGDPDSNPALRTAIQNARENNMPSDNIEKAIKRGTGELPGVTYESHTFEGYAPGGVALLIESLTDNHKRTSAEMRHLFSKHGGHLAEPHSVTYLFEKKGIVVINGSEVEEDEVFEVALDKGAEDVRSEGGVFEVLCDPSKFEELRDGFRDAGIKYQLAEVSLYPNNTVGLDREQAIKVLKLVNALEDNDDVQHVSANFDIPDEIMDEIEDEI